MMRTNLNKGTRQTQQGTQYEIENNIEIKTELKTEIKTLARENNTPELNTEQKQQPTPDRYARLTVMEVTLCYFKLSPKTFLIVQISIDFVTHGILVPVAVDRETGVG